MPGALFIVSSDEFILRCYVFVIPFSSFRFFNFFHFLAVDIPVVSEIDPPKTKVALSKRYALRKTAFLTYRAYRFTGFETKRRDKQVA